MALVLQDMEFAVIVSLPKYNSILKIKKKIIFLKSST
jgi:hypothetical protein